MAKMPGAEWQGEHSPGLEMDRWDVLCIHTIVGFAPAHAAHFSTFKDGAIVQSRDTRFRSAANLNGNHRVIAIENEDAAQDVPLSAEQVEACARILAWAHETHGIPLQLCPDSKPSSRGLAYHRQGIDGNFGGFRYPGRVSGGEVWSESFGKICPRDKRIAQLPAILARAKQIVEGDDVTPEQARQLDQILAQAKKNGRLSYQRDQKILDALSALADATDDAATKAQVRRVREDIAALSGDDSPQP